jgi:hypothetical protein
LVLAAAGLTATGTGQREVPQALTATPPVDPYGVDGGTVPQDSEHEVPLLPPAVSPPPVTAPVAAPVRHDQTMVSLPGSAGIPGMVLIAYQRAAQAMQTRAPGCKIPVALLAAIGKVESGHARGGQVDANGTALQPILGPMLNGGGFAAIGDTDGGALDGSASWDRAVGPMQFIPSTWRNWAVDGNGDGVANPENVFDASLAAASYLCAGGRDLATPGGLDSAILSYNHSDAYLSLVRAWLAAYSGVGSDTVGVPDIQTVAGTTPLDPPSITPAGPNEGGGTDVQAGGPHGGNPATTVPPTSATPPPATSDPTNPPSTPSTPSSPSMPPGSTQPSSGPLSPVLDPVTGVLTCVVGGVGDVLGGLLGGLLGGGGHQDPDLDNDGIPDAQECAG